jgi:capsular exopolysaccharide synthesis family protein
MTMNSSVALPVDPGSVRMHRPPAENTYYVRDAITALRERWLAFALVFVLVSGPSIWLVASLRPTYVATARVLIEPNERLRLNVESAVSGITLDSESVRSEVEVLKSPDLAQRVLERLSPKVIQDLGSEQSGLFQVLSYVKQQFLQSDRQEAPEAPLITRFLQRVTVTPVERSRVITVAYRSYDPEIAAEVANTLAHEYIEIALDLKREGTRETADWLARRMAELQSSVDTTERAIEAHRARYDLVQGDGTGLIAERLTHANLALSQARTRLADITARLSRLTSDPPERSSEVLSSYVIQQLRIQEADLEKQVAELATTTGNASPTMMGRRNALARVRQSIADETSRIRASLQNDAEAARALQRSLQQEVDTLTRRLGELRTATIGLRALERDADATRAIYENVLLRIKDVVAQESFLRRDARIIGLAVPPTSPASLSPAILMAGCLAAGLIAASFVVRILVHFEPGFRRVQDVERATRVSVLSAIPKIKFGKDKQGFGGQAYSEQRTRFAESIDMLLGRVMIGKSSSRGTVVTVSSCLAGEGKTYVSLALAHLAARIGYKCLIIDGDVRAPRLTRSLGLQASPGLSDVLDQTLQLDDVVTKVGDSGLCCLGVGRSTQVIQRLLGSGPFRSMIDQLTHDFDLVIIDTSPITVAAEPEVFAQVADQTLLVVQWNRTPRHLVQDSIARLSKATSTISGIVLSQVKSRRSLEVYGDT